MTPEQFANFCTVTVGCDEHGREAFVHAEANFRDRNGRDHHFEKAISLGPIVQQVANAMRAYHARLEAELHGPDMETSGWLDDIEHAVGDAVSTVKSYAGKAEGAVDDVKNAARDAVNKVTNVAKSIAANKAVAAVYNQVKTNPVVRGAIGLLPGGGTALQAIDDADKVVAIAAKAHDQLVKAIDGDPAAKEKVAAVKAAADQGHPAAITAVKVMRFQLAALKAKAEKVAAPATRVMTGPILPPPTAAVERMVAAIEPMEHAFRFFGHVRPGGFYARGLDVVSGILGEFDTDPTWADIEDPEEFSPDMETSGWLYNVPYRTPLQYIADPTHAPALIFRSLYEQGIH